MFTGTAGSSFAAAATATGLERFVGSGASAFGSAIAAIGAEVFTGTAASSHGFALAAAGLERFQAAGGSTFPAIDSAAAEQRFVGDAASSFGFSTAGSADTAPPVTGAGGSTFVASVVGSGAISGPPLPTTGGGGAGFVVPRRPRRARIVGASASAFGIRVEGRGLVRERQLVVGRGAIAFRAALAGSATLDLEPLRIALEDEAWLLGIDDEELVPAS